MSYRATRLAAAIVADVDQYVTSVNMKVGAYTLAASTPSTAGARHVTCTRTVAGAADTAGTIVVVGKSLAGQTITETLTVGANGILVTGTKLFASVTSVTGAGWVIAEANDTITVGEDDVCVVAEGSGVLHSIVVGTTAAGSITIADASGTLALLKASIPEGVYEFDLTYSGYLRVEPVAASDITVVHTPSNALTYAMS
jgi:hypothetical protein